jgi:hypothetical protein
MGYERTPPRSGEDEKKERGVAPSWGQPRAARHSQRKRFPNLFRTGGPSRVLRVISLAPGVGTRTTTTTDAGKRHFHRESSLSRRTASTRELPQGQRPRLRLTPIQSIVTTFPWNSESFHGVIPPRRRIALYSDYGRFMPPSQSPLILRMTSPRFLPDTFRVAGFIKKPF